MKKISSLLYAVLIGSIGYANNTPSQEMVNSKQPATSQPNCNPESVPYYENFDDLTPPDIPECAQLEVINGDYEGNGWSTRDVSSKTGFSGNALRHGWGATEALDSWYFTPGISLEADTDYVISFKYSNDSNFATEKLKVAYGTSPESTEMDEVLIDLDDINNLNDTYAIAEETFSVDDDGVYYFGFQAYSDADEFVILVDNISIDLPSSCPRPTDITADAITDTDAEISWTSNGDEEEWEVIWGESGFDINTEGTLVSPNPTDTEVELDNLDSATKYDIYVRAVCDSNETSSWEGPYTITTLVDGGYCIPNYYIGCLGNDFIHKVTLEGENGTLENDSTCDFDDFDGYSDYSDLTPVDLLPGETYNLEVEIQVYTSTYPNAHLRAWIDYNDDGVFDEDEEIARTDQGLTDAPQSFEFTVPEDAEGGNHRLRIRLVTQADSDLDPCDEYDFGETEDYMINIGSLSVEDHDFEGFSYFPNPAKNQLTLKANEQIEEVILYNTIGQKVINLTPNTQEETINVESLQKGIYMMKVSLNGTEKTFKVIKE